MNVDQPSRSELESGEALTVRSEGRVIVDAAGHVAEVRRREAQARDGLEVEDAECLVRRLDHGVLRKLLQLAQHAISANVRIATTGRLVSSNLEESSDRMWSEAGGSEEWAGGKVAQERPPS